MVSDLSQADFQRIFSVFKLESDEHIQALSRGLIALEENPEQHDLIEAIFRDAHSLKGAARMLHLSGIERIAHAIETMLGRVKNRQMLLSSEVNDLILKGLDAVETIIQRIDAGAPEETLDLSQLFQKLEDFSNSDQSPLKKPSSAKVKKSSKKIASVLKGDLKLFSEETLAAHQKLVKDFQKLRKQPGDLKMIKSAYEKTHILKGSARIVKHILMGDLAEKMEGLLRAALDTKSMLSEKMCADLHAAAAYIKIFIAQVVTKKKAEKPSGFDGVCAALDDARISLFSSSNKKESIAALPMTRVSKKIEKKQVKTIANTVRVSSEKLDHLMGQAGELLVLKLKARQRLKDTQEIITDYNFLNREIKNKAGRFGKVDREEAALSKDPNCDGDSQWSIGERCSGISDRLESLEKALFDDFRQFSAVIERLQDDVRKTRLFPFQTVLDIFPRMVRDLAASVKKKVKLRTSGGNIELDKYILEEIKDPLMHIIRNCIDHGIESPALRARLKKTVVGQIQIDVSHKGNHAVIQVSDDGCGIDLAQIKISAIKKGLYEEGEINLMKEKQILNLIFHSGFSTRAMITDISGRGVGMDVVKSNIEKLNGTIEIETLASKGSTFVMTIPLTLSTTQCLKISVSGAMFFLPVNKVERIINVLENDLSVIEGYPVVNYAGSYIPYVHMREILEVPNMIFESDKRPVAILKAGKTLVAFAMDDFLGEEEILMKGLGNYMKRVRHISGVTIMRDGRISPILNVTDMMNTVLLRGISHSKIKVEQEIRRSTKCVLVVDDSVMTRTLAKNILESYGFDVVTAVDGEDAFLKLEETVVDLIVSDVQMPNMDGFAFTRRLKQDESMKHIPVVLVTALESEGDKKEGIEVGADAYIMKSAFDQSNLVSTIQSLL